MNVVCFTKSITGDTNFITGFRITIGKIYHVLNQEEQRFNDDEKWIVYDITDDDNKKIRINSEFFEPLDKIRNEKLKQLGI